MEEMARRGVDSVEPARRCTEGGLATDSLSDGTGLQNMGGVYMSSPCNTECGIKDDGSESVISMEYMARGVKQFSDGAWCNFTNDTTTSVGSMEQVA